MTIVYYILLFLAAFVLMEGVEVTPVNSAEFISAIRKHLEELL